MARPKIALISREAVLEVALDILVKEGLDALSIRRIAKEIGVNGASLYHHFKNKEDIINGATELALKKTPLHPSDDSPHSWESLLSAGAGQLRDFLLTHPPLIAIFSQRRVAGLANQFLEGGVKRLVTAGMPIGIIIPLSEALEALAIGWAMRHLSDGTAAHDDYMADVYPLLYQASQKRFLPQDAIFEETVTGIIKSFKQLFDNSITAGKPDG